MLFGTTNWFKLFETPVLHFHWFYCALHLGKSDCPFILCKKQKQPRGVFEKRCSENMQQIYRMKPMPKCAKSEITFRHGCYPVKLLHVFRISMEGCFWKKMARSQTIQTDKAQLTRFFCEAKTKGQNLVFEKLSIKRNQMKQSFMRGQTIYQIIVKLMC